MRLITVAALFAAPAAAQVPQALATPDAPVVGIAVTEAIESAPDLALFDVGVATTSTTASAAIAQNARKMENVIARVRSAGVAANDIQTTGISLYPQHSRPPRTPDGGFETPRIIGYTANNNVRVRYRRLDQVGALLDALVGAGATNLNGPQFAISDPTARLGEARNRALATAGARANAYAAKSGARAIRLLSITEGASGVNGGGEQIIVTGSRGESGAAVSSPVAPGQITTQVTLFVQYALVR